MTATQCTDEHTCTITGPAGETIATTTNGPKLAWVQWTNAGPDALDLTATHPDGAACPAETRAARALLPGGPYDTRKQARTDGQPLLDAADATDAGGPSAVAVHEARRKAAADYLTGRLAHHHDHRERRAPRPVPRGRVPAVRTRRHHRSAPARLGGLNR